MAVLIAQPAGAGVAPPTVAAVERASLDARLAIKTAEVTLVARGQYTLTPSPGGPANDPTELLARRTLWRSGNRLRGDIFRERGPDTGRRYIQCLNCERDGLAVDAVESTKTASSVFELTPDRRTDLTHAVDPRLLGYAPRSFATLGQARLDELVGSTDRDEPTLDRESLAGADCYRLRWTNKAKSRIGVWIDPARGHNVVKIEAELARAPKGRATTLTVRSDLMSVPGSGLWYPNRVEFRRTTDGVVTEDEVTEVSAVSLNRPIPEETFTLAGMGLPDGASIMQPPGRPTGDLIGGVVTPPAPTAPGARAPPVPIDPRPGVNPWLVASCVVCALGAVVLIVRSRKRAH